MKELKKANQIFLKYVKRHKMAMNNFSNQKIPRLNEGKEKREIERDILCERMLKVAQ